MCVLDMFHLNLISYMMRVGKNQRGLICCLLNFINRIIEMNFLFLTDQEHFNLLMMEVLILLLIILELIKNIIHVKIKV